MVVLDGFMSFHVRRKDREITDPEEMRQVLKTTQYVTVALCMDNEPYLVSLSHGYDKQKTASTFTVRPKAKNSSTKKPTAGFGGKRCWISASPKNATTLTLPCISAAKWLLINDLSEKQHAMEVLVRQVSLNPEMKYRKD